MKRIRQVAHRTLTAWGLFLWSDEPIRQRLREATRNLLLRAERHSDCCGHYGEPGC